MMRLLLVIIFTGTQFFSAAQDFITVKKKNGTPLKTFVAGSPIIFQTFDGDYVNGPIEILRNDSLFIRFYDVRTYMTTFGTTIADTVTTFLIGYHYKDIKRIQLFGRAGSGQSSIGKILVIGGAGYFALNIINGAYFKDSVTDKKNLKRLAISAGAVGTGILINKLSKGKNFSSKKDKITYVNMK